MMKKTAVIALLGLMMTPAVSITAYAGEALISKGKEVAFDRKKGNCLACHAIDDGALPGSSGPPLIAMQVRFPDKDALRAQIYNPLDRNPDSLMPPFGLHNILNDAEIDAIVAYLLTL